MIDQPRPPRIAGTTLLALTLLIGGCALKHDARDAALDGRRSDIASDIALDGNDVVDAPPPLGEVAVDAPMDVVSEGPVDAPADLGTDMPPIPDAGPCPGCLLPSTCCSGVCTNVATDIANCGTCGLACPAVRGVPSCTAGACAIVCESGFADCESSVPGCETDTRTTDAHCGMCSRNCGPGRNCVNGGCVRHISTGAEGPYAPTGPNVVITAGVHNFTTIDIPAGTTVRMMPNNLGVLDLRATGTVIITGTIDVSGGPGTTGSVNVPGSGPETGTGGNGGHTGVPASAGGGLTCQQAAGNNGRGPGPVVAPTGCLIVANGSCGPAGAGPANAAATGPNGGAGGAGVYGGYRSYGAGGGGVAGGGPGDLGAVPSGDIDICANVAGGGGAVPGRGGNGGNATYSGQNTARADTPCTGSGADGTRGRVSGGAGGSIGVAAAADLAMVTTFGPGSGGGGGSIDFSHAPSSTASAGGGGGGGALRITSLVSIEIVASGAVLANGGNGGDAFTGTGTPNCRPAPGAAGGGGSGGAIDLYAPRVAVAGRASALGGAGGPRSSVITGGGGGDGGLGRIRIGVDPAMCTLGGTFTPQLHSGCAVTAGNGTSARVYVSPYPN